MRVIEQFGLRQDPFGPASGVSGCGVALSMLEVADRLVAAVRRGDPLIVLVGRPGMGKTLLLSRLEQICRADGVEVCSIARGDMAHTAFGTTAQLLIIDEADTINAATMRALAPGAPGASARSMVVAATRPDLHRIAGDVVATIIDLKPLDPLEAHQFLEARAKVAGRPDLFAPDALDVIVEAGRGSPRLLRVLAGAAMFQAAVDDAKQVTAAHASLAATMHRSLIGRPEPEIRLPVAANDVVPFVRPAEGGHPSDNVVPLAPRAPVRRQASLLPLAASVALAALIMPSFLSLGPEDEPFAPGGQAQAARQVAGPVELAAAAFTVAPANAAGRSEARAPAWAPPLKLAAAPNMAASVPVVREAARTVTASIDAGPTLRPQLADLGDMPRSIAIHRPRLDAMGGNARTLVTDLLAAARVRPTAVGQRGRDGSSADDGMDDDARLAAALAAVPVETPAPITLTTPASIAATLSQALFDEPVRAAVVAPVRTAGLDVGHVDRSGPSVDTARPVEQPRVAAAAASTARQAADQAQSAKDGAAEAKAAKQASDQAKAAKQTSNQGRSAKESAAQAKAAKDAADQAKDAKEAADKAKEAKEAVEQAKAAKEAADQAKAAKEAAEQAKAAKEAAEQAKAAKEAADQAKSAKEAVEQAKAAKEAADQAKAAKEAAEQAKAAKEAAEQAKAAKDAAEQAKAAKEAADQAKAAKEAADVAKDAKDAVDQARAAKEAAKAAKDAAKDAAKAARDVAKAAKDARKGN